VWERGWGACWWEAPPTRGDACIPCPNQYVTTAGAAAAPHQIRSDSFIDCKQKLNWKCRSQLTHHHFRLLIIIIMSYYVIMAARHTVQYTVHTHTVIHAKHYTTKKTWKDKKINKTVKRKKNLFSDLKLIKFTRAKCFRGTIKHITAQDIKHKRRSWAKVTVNKFFCSQFTLPIKTVLEPKSLEETWVRVKVELFLKLKRYGRLWNWTVISDYCATLVLRHTDDIKLLTVQTFACDSWNWR